MSRVYVASQWGIEWVLRPPMSEHIQTSVLAMTPLKYSTNFIYRGCRGSSVGKGACFVSLKSCVWIPSTHSKSWARLPHPCNHNNGKKRQTESESLLASQSSWHGELWVQRRLCLKALRWEQQRKALNSLFWPLHECVLAHSHAHTIHKSVVHTRSERMNK